MTTTHSHAAVLGGGLAGTLAAHVLARHFDAVTVVERDELPEGAAHRKGVPQARHAHILWSGGARVIEDLLPGFTARLTGRGARRLGVQRDLVSSTPYGWQHRFPATQYILACGRPLLDWTVREMVLGNPRITLCAGTEAVGLLGGRDRVTGVRVRDVADGTARHLDADLVIDATGRGSHLPDWLRALGAPAVQEAVIDPGLAYATRVFAPPQGTPEDFPMIALYADHRTGQPGRNGIIVPIEDGRWIVTLSGTRGGEPASGEDGFTAFARSLRHELLATLIAAADPLTPVQASRSTVNRRRHFERAAVPEGLIALGDAVVALNPVHGHGMSAAARCAQALDATLTRAGGGVGGGAAGGGAAAAATAGFCRRAQQAIAAAVDDPWALATTHDLAFPDCRSTLQTAHPDPAAAQRRAFVDLIGTLTLRDPDISAAMTAVTALEQPVASLEDPRIVTLLRRPAAERALTEPPLNEAEREFVARLQGVAAGAGG